MNNICIVGAGKVAYSLTKALLDAQYNVCSVFSRTKGSAEKLASKFNLPCCADNVSAIPSNSALFFIAVPDSEIENAAQSLFESNIHFENAIFVHLSGSQDVSSLKALKDKGASVASFHIMQTFPSNEVVDIKDHFAAIESDDDDTLQFLFSLARKLHLRPFSISSEKKVYYHLTGVFASNFLIANIYNASLVFKKSNIADVPFADVVKPIVQSTLANIEKNGIENSLSGPVARGDIATVKKHVDSLKSENHILISYLINSLTLLDLISSGNGPLSEDQKDIKKFLSEELVRINPKL